MEQTFIVAEVKPFIIKDEATVGIAVVGQAFKFMNSSSKLEEVHLISFFGVIFPPTVRMCYLFLK